MKSLIILAGLFFFSVAYAQKSDNMDIPSVVKEKFSAVYKNVNKVKWNKEKTGYEANFKIGKENKSVTFDKIGKIIDTETEMKASNLPNDILASVKKDFAGYKITEAAKIETDGIISYEAEVTRGKDKMDLIYDGKGNLKSKTKISAKD